MRREAVDTLLVKLNDHYVFPDKAKQIEAVLRQRQHEGKYDGITDGEQLAKQLTDDLHSVANDLHMAVEFSPRLAPPDDAVGLPPASLAEWEQGVNIGMRLFRHVSNLGVEKVVLAPHDEACRRHSGFPDARRIRQSPTLLSKSIGQDSRSSRLHDGQRQRRRSTNRSRPAFITSLVGLTGPLAVQDKA